MRTFTYEQVVNADGKDSFGNEGKEKTFGKGVDIMFFDPTYILVLFGAIICMIASANVKSTYQKYSAYRSMTGMTGAQVAERLLRSAGIQDVRVGHVAGELSDHRNFSNTLAPTGYSLNGK